MTNAMIEVESLTKYYGDFLALDNLTFSAAKGEIVGLLGSNGSGKTTTMRILSGYMSASSGTARIAGHDVSSNSLETRRRIGYLPENTPLYSDMTVTAYLQFMGKLQGLRAPRLERRIADVIGLCQLGSYAMTLIGRLSKGYRQRIGIARAILHEPPVLILDEPTIGLDPTQVIEMRELIRQLGRDCTILLSTHILAEAQALCQRIVILHEGMLVAVDTPVNLTNSLSRVQRIELDIRGPAEIVTATLRAVPGVVRVSHRPLQDGILTYLVETPFELDIRDQLAQTVVSQKWAILRLTHVSVGLEELFVRLTSQDRGDDTGRTSR